MIINFNIFSVELCWHSLFHDRMSIWWSLDAKKHLISSLCYKSVKLTFIYPTLTKRPAEIALSGCDNDSKCKRYLI